jgi:ABC-2 type transport system permease protein
MNVSVVTSPLVRARGRHRLLFLDLLRAEWTKLRTLRSTAWTLASTVVLTVGFGALFMSRYHKPEIAAAYRPGPYSLSGFYPAQLAVVVLGALIMTGEFSTGSIRAACAAVPQRRALLAAKAVVLAGVCAVAGIATSLAAFFLGQALIGKGRLEAHLGDPGVARAIIGFALYLTVTGLLALGVGTLIPHAAGAIATVVGLLAVLPQLANALPASLQNTVQEYLPSNAGQAIIGRTKFAPPYLLPPWAGLGVFCGCAAAALIGAAVILDRRDL